MNLYKITFHAEVFIEAEDEAAAIAEVDEGFQPSGLIPIADLIGDADELRVEDAERRAGRE